MPDFVLLDTDKDISMRAFSADGSLPNKDCRIHLTTLEGGLRTGVQALTLANGPLEIVLLPQRGLGVWRGAVDGVRLGWNSPIKGPVHPAFVPEGQSDGLGWLWGFDEWVARCGLESNGAPEFDDKDRVKYPLHGRIANRPAHKLSAGYDQATGELYATGEVDEARLHFQKLRLRTTYRMKVGARKLTVVDEIVNLSGSPAEAQMLYHINFGPPLCAPGARLVAPVETIVARTPHAAADIGHWEVLGPARAGFEEQVYFFALHADAAGDTQALLRDPTGEKGVSVGWNVKQLSCFTLWKNTVSFEDGYVVGIEPGTNYPNPRSHESAQGRTVKLPPAGVHRMEWSVEFHPSKATVDAAAERIEALRAGRAPNIMTTKPGWIP